MNKIEEALIEYWGEKCEDFDEDCPCCQAWREYDSLARYIVVSKLFEPEHVEYHRHTHKIGDVQWIDKTPYTVPDTYTICLRGEYDGSEYTRIVKVDRQNYKLIKIGQKLDINDLPLKPTAEEPNE